MNIVKEYNSINEDLEGSINFSSEENTLEYSFEKLANMTSAEVTYLSTEASTERQGRDIGDEKYTKVESKAETPDITTTKLSLLNFHLNNAILKIKCPQ